MLPNRRCAPPTTEPGPEVLAWGNRPGDPREGEGAGREPTGGRARIEERQIEKYYILSVSKSPRGSRPVLKNNTPRADTLIMDSCPLNVQELADAFWMHKVLDLSTAEGFRRHCACCPPCAQKAELALNLRLAIREALAEHPSPLQMLACCLPLKFNAGLIPWRLVHEAPHLEHPARRRRAHIREVMSTECRAGPGKELGGVLVDDTVKRGADYISECISGVLSRFSGRYRSRVVDDCRV